jgi:bacterioferritin
MSCVPPGTERGGYASGFPVDLSPNEWLTVVCHAGKAGRSRRARRYAIRNFFRWDSFANRIHHMNDQDTQRAVGILNKIMEHELAGVVRYMHYSLMIYGYNRIPIVSWLKSNADESLAHAHKAGELVTLLGGHPSLKIGTLLETEKHDVGDILQESLEHEKAAVASYYELLKVSEGKSVLLEEYAREMIVGEELHLDEVNKMLRKSGDVQAFRS